MRVASFRVPAAGGASCDLSVVRLPGEAGGRLANVNRWRGQLGLDPLDGPALDRASTRVDAPAGRVWLVDFSGRGEDGRPLRLLGGVLERSGETWFFKLTGEPGAAGSAADALKEFLRSLHEPRRR
jgi:hypothetical protein